MTLKILRLQSELSEAKARVEELIQAHSVPADSISRPPEEFVFGLWCPIADTPHDDYVTILVAVESPDGDLTHRLAMWDPENDDWTVFQASWSPTPIFATPLLPLPTER